VPRLRQLRHHLLDVAAPGLDVSGSLPGLGLVAAADSVRDLVTAGLRQLGAADQAVWEVS
jgi:hypothetical protein